MYDIVVKNGASQLLFLGMSLDEVITASTTKLSEVLGKQNKIGTLGIDACADLTIFKLDEGKFTFLDVEGNERISRQKLTVTNVIKNGEVVVQDLPDLLDPQVWVK